MIVNENNMKNEDYLEEVEEVYEEKLNQKGKVAKVGFWSFVSMIFMTCYGLSNGQQVYYQMGYASITYVIIGVVLFFIPYTFIVSEMSSAFHNEKGGIFSWMKNSVGLRFSTIGAFIWYISGVIWWFSISSICITLSTMIFGKDESETWHIFGLSNTGTTAIIGIIWFLIIVFFCRRGIKSISKLANISMLVTILMHIIILGGGLFVFFMNGAHFQQPFHYTGIQSLFMGPNKAYDNVLAALGFLVFAIFALGGMEASGGLIDKVKNPKKNVPRAMIMSGIIIAILYISIIIISGMAMNWKETFNSSNVNLYNYSIYMVQQQFFEFGKCIGLSNAASVSLGEWVNRITTWITFIAMLNLPLMLYYPIKQMFEGMPKGMLPKFLTKENKYGMTANALYVQAAIIIGAMLLIGFGGNTANTVYNNLTYMVTISTSIPWAFIVFSYIKFKLNDDIKKEYQFFNKKWGVVVGSITFITLVFANGFSIVQPFLQHNYQQGIWIVSGPLIFGFLGWILAEVYLKRKEKNLIK